MKTRTFFISNFSRCAILSAILVYATVASAETPIHLFGQFSSSDGSDPYAGLVEGKQGTLFGTTVSGGEYNQGTVFEMIPPTVSGEAWTETVLYSFAGKPDGSMPTFGSLIFDQDGNLYGVTNEGGLHGTGAVFELSPPAVSPGPWTEAVLYSFKKYGNLTDGWYPAAGLVIGWEGSLYGTTTGGGAFGDGTVFRLTKSTTGTWSEGVIHSFNSSDGDGMQPSAGLAHDKAGNLYGTTILGGSGSCSGGDGCGIVFELSPPSVPGEPWTETILHMFAGIGDGSNPSAPLIFDGIGNLYGTTKAGGTEASYGTVYELSPGGGGWTESIVYSFTGGSDGAFPYAGVVFDSMGDLYGTTAYDGSRVVSECHEVGCGAVFKLSPPTESGELWSETTLHDFKTGSPEHDDGYVPYGTLIFGKYGALYGTTVHGGFENGGTVFSIQP